MSNHGKPWNYGKKLTLDQLLEKYIEPIPETGCHIWSGHTVYGYGYTGYGGTTGRVHRKVYEAVNGPIPEGMLVLHKCDVRACCNPKHLFLGTHAENMKDMTDKKRQAVGEKVGGAKLTPEQVKIILNTKRKTNYLSQLFGISKTNIKDVRRRRTWRHIDGEIFTGQGG